MSDQELFMRNSEAVGKLLRESGTGRSAAFYTEQLFPVLSREEIDKFTEAREKALKDPYKEIRKGHAAGYQA